MDEIRFDIYSVWALTTVLFALIVIQTGHRNTKLNRFQRFITGSTFCLHTNVQHLFLSYLSLSHSSRPVRIIILMAAVTNTYQVWKHTRLI